MIIELLFLINMARQTPLQESSILNERASIRAEQLCKANQWSHNNWKTSFTGLKYNYAGENLAIDFKTDIDVFIAFMNSPKHKDNIVNKKFKQIGIGKGSCNNKVVLFMN